MSKTIHQKYLELINKTKILNRPEIEIRMILCYTNKIENMSKYFLLENNEQKNEDLTDQLIERYLNNEPVQYLIGSSSFFEREFVVNPDVLIPRMETEEVVECAIKLIKENFDNPKVIDVCSGSGCIGITLAKELVISSVTLLDISEKANAVARQNCNLFDVNSTILCGDILNYKFSEKTKYDVLISNPPYIRNKSEIDISTSIYEPNEALYPSSCSVVDFYEGLFKKAKEILNPKSLQVYEIGYDLIDELEILSKKFFPSAEIKFYKDMSNNYRILTILATK